MKKIIFAVLMGVSASALALDLTSPASTFTSAGELQKLLLVWESQLEAAVNGVTNAVLATNATYTNTVAKAASALQANSMTTNLTYLSRTGVTGTLYYAAGQLTNAIPSNP